MSWLTIILLRMFALGILGAYLTKWLADSVSRLDRFFILYLLQAIAVICLCFVTTQEVHFSWELFLVGLGNSFGTYCLWRAYSISVSKASVLMIGDDLIALGLGYLLLGEVRFLTPLLAVGVITILLCSVLQGLLLVRKSAEERSRYRDLIIWALGFSIPWGIVDFYLAYANKHQVSLASFAISYYLGSLLMAFVIWNVLRERRKLSSLLHALSPRITIALVVLSILNVGSFFLDYITFGLAPITVVQPWLQVGGLVIPSLVGFLFFAEHKQFDRVSMLIYVIAFLGALTIAYAHAQ